MRSSCLILILNIQGFNSTPVSSFCGKLHSGDAHIREAGLMQHRDAFREGQPQRLRQILQRLERVLLVYHL